jgi:hypothetical protein
MASLIQFGKISASARIMNAVLAAVKIAVLVYFIMYAVQAYKSPMAARLATYRDLLLPALIALFLTASPIVAVLALVAWAVSEACNKDIRGLLIAICVILGLEILFQIGVVATGQVAMGLDGPASMRLGLGVVGRNKARSKISVSA